MDTNIIIAVIGVVIAILTYFAGVKKSSNAETEQRARFEGEIKAKLDQLNRSFEKLEAKLDKNADDLYTEIHKRISEHERRYHNEQRT